MSGFQEVLQTKETAVRSAFDWFGNRREMRSLQAKMYTLGAVSGQIKDNPERYH